MADHIRTMAYTPRDPARIERLLNQLRELWCYDPDARLCQLIGNELGTGDHYHVEDEALSEHFERTLQRLRRPNPTA